MRSGAVGINLTAASHIFLLEPMLNPALEAQAIGRAWRMGQTRAVTVKKLYVKGTVEERIMDVMKTRSKAPQVGAAAAELAATSNGKKARAGPPGLLLQRAALPVAREKRSSAAGLLLLNILRPSCCADCLLFPTCSQVKASELAGAIKADKQDLRLNELEVLFS